MAGSSRQLRSVRGSNEKLAFPSAAGHLPSLSVNACLSSRSVWSAGRREAPNVCCSFERRESASSPGLKVLCDDENPCALEGVGGGLQAADFRVAAIAPDVHDGQPLGPLVLRQVGVASHDDGVALLDELVRARLELCSTREHLLEDLDPSAASALIALLVQLLAASASTMSSGHRRRRRAVLR